MFFFFWFFLFLFLFVFLFFFFLFFFLLFFCFFFFSFFLFFGQPVLACFCFAAVQLLLASLTGDCDRQQLLQRLASLGVHEDG